MDQPALNTEIDPQALRRVGRIGCTLGILLLLGVLLLSSVGPYTEYLWFLYDARQPQVFTKAYETKGLLFLVALPIIWAILYFNLRQALNLTLVFLGAPETTGQAVVARGVKWLQDSGGTIVKLFAPLAAFVLANGFSNEWLTYLLWRNAKLFRIKDPMFGLDVSFYVFSLPWWRSIANTLFVVLLLTTVLSIGIYVGLQSLAALARIELSRPKFRVHVGTLIGFTLMSLAALTWLKSYEYVLVQSQQFTGAGYVESQQVFVERSLAVLIFIVGLASVLLPKHGRPYTIPIGGGMLTAIAWLLGMLIYPSAVRRLVVDPDRLGKESPFASRAIQMTRAAYGLDSIDVRSIDVKDRPAGTEVAASGSTLDNMRLWDPEILRRTFETLQGFRPYYRFEDVDIDRYDIAGKETMVMLSPRDIEINGLQTDAQNWTNMRLRYTHGYGLSMARVNQTTAEGRPAYLVKDIPLHSTGEVQVRQPRIYFSDWRDGERQPTSEYTIVNTGEPELDYETSSGPQTHKWQGNQGVPIAGFLARLAFSIALADGNLLVSPNVRSGARLIMRRNVLERAKAVYPFLRFDSDPYIVVLNGELIWILDGYSMTDMFPYSAPYFGVNYMRNSVKATINAYTGEMRAYAVLPQEPMLATYRSVYPGLVRDLSEAPVGLAEHFRYPEDLLSAQAAQLQTYHVTDPVTFLSNSDAWNIAVERDIEGQRAAIRPYYVQMKLPDEPNEGFLQILPFTPNRKANMSGWLAAHCDPGSYGRLTLYRFSGAAAVRGPEQMESDFNSTPKISEINRQFNNEQSFVLPGNLLVIPLGRSVMYVEPLFLQSKTQGIQSAPRLAWVVLAFGDQVVVGRTYQDALKQLLGTATEPTPSESIAPTTPKSGGNTGVREALDLLNEADAAQRAGNWARYGELQKRLRRKLEELTRG